MESIILDVYCLCNCWDFNWLFSVFSSLENSISSSLFTGENTPAVVLGISDAYVTVVDDIQQIILKVGDPEDKKLTLKVYFCYTM